MKFECAAAKKISFIRKNITLFLIAPPPSTAAAAVASTSKISNTFGALNIEGPKVVV